MDDDVITISRDVHCAEELRAMKQQGMTEAANRPISHLEDCHGSSIIPALHGYLCNSPKCNANQVLFVS